MACEIAPTFVEKPWGCDSILDVFGAPQAKRIGEVWFKPPPELDSLLLKFLFTAEKLSVQVHPTAEQAERRGLGYRGKDECWLVVDAEPNAWLGIGFRRPVGEDELRDPSHFTQLIASYEARVGDFFYIPANTVHAIGPGLVLIELQQNSDVTFRLFDYGRPRNLHLDEAVAIANRGVYPECFRKHIAAERTSSLVSGPYFRVDHIFHCIPDHVLSKYKDGPVMIVPLEGKIVVGRCELSLGQCGYALSVAEVALSPGGRCLIAQPIEGC